LMGDMLVADRTGYVLSALFAVTTALAALTSPGHQREHDWAVGEYYGVMLMSASGMVMLAHSANLPKSFDGWDFYSAYSQALAYKAGRAVPLVVGNDGAFGGVGEAQRVRGESSAGVLMLAPGSGLGSAFIDANGLPLQGDTLAGMETAKLPVATFNATRETEYGLAFYRNQVVSNYNRGEIPAGQHLLVAREGSEDQLKALLPERRISHLGGLPTERLEYFWVSAPGMAMPGMKHQ